MALRRPKAAPSTRIREAEIAATTSRVLARWDALRRILPWGLGGAAAVGVAAEIAGKVTVVSVNWVLGASLTVTVPAGLAKVLWDRAQKKRLRKRQTQLEAKIAELEQEKLQYVAQVGQLNGQIKELRRLEKGGR